MAIKGQVWFPAVTSGGSASTVGVTSFSAGSSLLGLKSGDPILDVWDIDASPPIDVTSNFAPNIVAGLGVFFVVQVGAVAPGHRCVATVGS